MKKAAILSIASFYLLLTTGMYVCLIHCAGECFFKPEMKMQASNHQGHHSCSKDKNCDCCKKHGIYIIKENIKPATDFQVQQMGLMVDQPVALAVLLHYPVFNALASKDIHAPPGITGKYLSIKFHSLQI